MENKPLNRSLHAAKATKKDEFYTQLSDIEKELRHYSTHFKNKTVLCNCDDPKVSKFFHYFSHSFEKLKLKKLLTTCCQHKAEKGIYLEYDGDKNENRVPDPDEIGIHKLKGDGDFRSEECVKLLKQADIVVTNPPFSLFRDYVAQLMKYEKKFIIIGHQNAITYKGIFTFLKENKMWLGYGFNRNCAHFINPNYVDYASDADHREGMIRVSGIAWFTNLDTKKRHEDLILYETYDSKKYPFYDNYDAIEVSKTADIPKDYKGVMGVPVTFVNKYNPDQFEIIGATESEGAGFSSGLWNPDSGVAQAAINGKRVYKRLFVRNRRPA
jgi:hypothetical protein